MRPDRARAKNLIILTSDELRGDALGFMGNPDCRTPHLDAFAARGAAFHNHFAPHGKCVPSRIAMVTGRYAHTDGFRTIHQHLPPDQPDLLSTLRQRYGYETAVFGHNHVWETLFSTNEVGAGYSDYHSFTGHYHDMAFTPYPVPDPGPEGRSPMALDPLDFHYAGRIEGEITGFSDDARTDQAIDYLTQTRDPARPFYLHVNLSRPHPKYAVEEPYFSMYDPAAIRPWPYDLPAGAPLPLRAMREVRTGRSTSEAAFREVQAVYYGMVTKVDSLFGKLLATIEREGLFEDSIVIFTVDHGDFAGQYGLVEKWDTCMADCILHVPFVLWDPDLPHGVRMDGLTSHVDLAPTILALLDRTPDWAPPWGMHGTSLLPVFDGGPGRDAVFADGGHEREMWDRFDFERRNADGTLRPLDGKQRTYRDYPESMARTKMVRTARWKLVTRLAGGDELYDMQRDPYEMHNLWGRHREDPELMRVVLGLQQRMIAWCLRTDTDRPYQEQVGA